MEVLVEHDYAAEESDELSIKKGDIIKDVSQFEEGWFIGNLNGKVGVFPDNFVKKIERPQTQKKTPPPGKESSCENTAQSTLDHGDGKNETPKRPIGIGLGNIFSGQPIQLKLTSMKDAKKEADANSERTIHATQSGDDYVQARFEYQPKHSDELELMVNDVIQVLDRSLPDEGWWKGKSMRTKKTGVFPDNFVVPYTDPVEETNARAKQPVGVNNAKSVSIASVTLQNDSVQNKAPQPELASEPPKVAIKPSATSLASAEARGKTTSGSRPAFPSVGAAQGDKRTVNVTRSSEKLKMRGGAEEANTGRSTEIEPVPETNAAPPLQRLTSCTSDRPRQPGRRPPSKIVRVHEQLQGAPVNGAFDVFLNEAEVTQETVPPASESTFQSPEAPRANGAVPRSADTKTSRSTIQSRQSPLQRSEGPSGSAELVQRSQAQAQVCTSKLQTQLSQLQTQYNQLAAESKQQIRELRLQLDQAKDQNSQLRSDMMHSQRMLTERLQFLMDELDELKKQRASDAVELARLRVLCMQLDAKALLSLGAQLSDRTEEEDAYLTKESDAHSLYDEADYHPKEVAPQVITNRTVPIRNAPAMRQRANVEARHHN